MKNEKIKWIPNLNDQAIALKKKIALDKIEHGYEVLLLETNGRIYKEDDQEIKITKGWDTAIWLDDMQYDVGYISNGFLYHCKPIMKNEHYESHIEIGEKLIRGMR